MEPCPACGGSRLNIAAWAYESQGHSIADASAMQAGDLAGWLDGLDLPTHLQAVRTSVLSGLGSMQQVGLGYLSLDRPTSTLSGGEAANAPCCTSDDLGRVSCPV